MTKRSPAAVFFLPIITCGIYAFVWYVKTKDEMNAKGAAIPTAWLLIVPFVNLYWLWKFCEGVDKVSNKAMSDAVAFLLILFLGSIGMAVVQSKLNSI